MADFENIDNARLIINVVDYAIVTLTDAVWLDLPASFSDPDGRG